MPLRSAVAALVVTVAAATTAGAHAFLERAEPRVGSTVRTAPARVQLWFTGTLESAYSRVRVVDEGGRRVDRDDAAVDPADPTLLRASLAALPSGRYRVIWRVLAVDGHVTEGDFTFRVAP